MGRVDGDKESAGMNRWCKMRRNGLWICFVILGK